MNSGIFDNVINIYKELESPGVDRWNPLFIEQELWHRVRILIALTRALRLIDIPINQARILDVGCGVGRSTRALLELGATPEKVVGIDIRPEAIAYAKRINPGISFYTVKDFDGWPSPGSFDMCMQYTVFSSIPGEKERSALAAMMERMLLPGGYIFWFDLIKANQFAGGDVLEPKNFFAKLEVVDRRLYHMRPTIVDVLIYNRIWGSRYYRNRINPTLERLLRKVTILPPTHCAVLFKRTD